MGGIKNKLNKLSKLSNKVKNLFNSLPLVGRADEMTKSSQSREGNRTKGSRLPSFSQPSKMPDGQISNTRKLSHLGLSFLNDGSLRPTSQSLPLAKGRQMSVAHRWGRITKHIGIACLSFAILSTLVLNIVSSYSSSKVNSNAEPVSNPSILANDSTWSISSHSATGDTNDGNLSLSIPQGGGLVAGRHTVSVKSNNINGYQLRVEAASGIEEDGGVVRPINLELVHDDGSVDKEHTIPSLTQNNDKNVNYGNTMPIENNTWGMAIPGSSLYGSSYDDVSVYESYITNPRSIDSANATPKFAGMYKYEDYTLPRLIIIR